MSDELVLIEKRDGIATMNHSPMNPMSRAFAKKREPRFSDL